MKSFPTGKCIAATVSRLQLYSRSRVSGQTKRRIMGRLSVTPRSNINPGNKSRVLVSYRGKENVTVAARDAAGPTALRGEVNLFGGSDFGTAISPSREHHFQARFSGRSVPRRVHSLDQFSGGSFSI